MTSPVRFDITGITLREYRSIARCTVRLRPLNLLVGPNGSGKSNFVDSLRFVSQSLNENLDNALRDRGGVSEVRRRSTGHPRHFGIGRTFRCADFSGEYHFRVGAAKGGDYRVTHESCRVAWHDGRPDSFFNVAGGEVLEASVQVAPRALDDRLYLVAMSGLEPFRPVFDGLTGMNVYNVNPESMREPQKPDPGELLRRDGANVASVLEAMRRANPARIVVEEFLQRIVPGIVSVDRKAVGAWESLDFRQEVAGADAPWQFQASSISDGTMRALGVLVALFAVDDGSPFASPVAIEEPETALHPAAAGYLLDALQEASHTRQVIATTHSPELLDSPELDPRSLISVRAEAGRTVIAPINVVGRQAILDGLYSAGELLRLDQLDPEAGEHPKPEPLVP